MNDEIKEILKSLKVGIDKQCISKPNFSISYNDVKKLLDYITNLQQELEEYKDTETYSKRFLYKANKDRLNANLELVKELEDYKSRCEKADEIINKYELIVGYYDYADEDGYWDTDSNNNLQKELKDILNGRSDE